LPSFRGEPAPDLDSIFVATNLALVSAAFVGLTFFGYFFDIFASVGFISLVFGLCRMYAATQRGRAVGNADYLPDFDPGAGSLACDCKAALRARRQLDPKSGARRQREYNRRLRRFLYAGSDAVMLEGVVERKSFMHEALSDLMVLVWHSETEDAARKSAEADLTRLTRYLAELDARLPDDGSVRMAFACTELDAGNGGRRTRPELAAGRNRLASYWPRRSNAHSRAWKSLRSTWIQDPGGKRDARNADWIACGSPDVFSGVSGNIRRRDQADHRRICRAEIRVAESRDAETRRGSHRDRATRALVRAQAGAECDRLRASE
jgi:hypothetical protein